MITAANEFNKGIAKVEVKLHIFLSSIWDGDWSASCSGHFSPKSSGAIMWEIRWSPEQSGHDGREKDSCPYQEFNVGSSAHSQLITNWAVPVLMIKLLCRTLPGHTNQGLLKNQSSACNKPNWTASAFPAFMLTMLSNNMCISGTGAEGSLVKPAIQYVILLLL
jgi:hypothetical protein